MKEQSELMKYLQSLPKTEDVLFYISYLQEVEEAHGFVNAAPWEDANYYEGEDDEQG